MRAVVTTALIRVEYKTFKDKPHPNFEKVMTRIKLAVAEAGAEMVSVQSALRSETDEEV